MFEVDADGGNRPIFFFVFGGWGGGWAINDDVYMHTILMLTRSSLALTILIS